MQIILKGLEKFDLFFKKFGVIVHINRMIMIQNINFFNFVYFIFIKLNIALYLYCDEIELLQNFRK